MRRCRNVESKRLIARLWVCVLAPALATVSCGDSARIYVDSPDSIFPLSVGASWTYRIHDPEYCHGLETAEYVVSSVEETDEGPVYAYESGCLTEEQIPQYLRREGTDRMFYLSPDAGDTWIVNIEVPVQDGVTWSNPAHEGSDYEWIELGEVTVSAGTFSDCWRRQSPVVFHDYCRGVGPIRHSNEAGELATELVDYEIPT